MRIVDLLSVGENEILITWSDEHRSLLEGRMLRVNCPCAQCVDEHTGQRILKPENVLSDIRVLQSLPVGRYGIRFNFSDGHNTGIYSYEYLRDLCSCQACGEGKK